MDRIITVEMYDAFPEYYNFYIHKLSSDGINIYFTENGSPFSVPMDDSVTPYYDVTCAVTINDIIIDEEMEPDHGVIFDDGTYGIHLRFDSYELFKGLMKIEVKIKSHGVDYYQYPVAPIMINVNPSIIDNASASPESVGSVSDMLQLYPTLSDWVENGVDSIESGAVGTNEIDDEAVTTAKIADEAVTTDKLDDDAVTTAKIADENVTYEKLDLTLQDKMDVIPDAPMEIVNKGSLSTANTFNSSAYCNASTFYKFTISNDLATQVGITSGKACEMRFVNSYQIITQTDTQQIFSRKVNSVAPSFSADSWNEIINPAITALQNTIGTLNTQLENALNGVSS